MKNCLLLLVYCACLLAIGVIAFQSGFVNGRDGRLQYFLRQEAVSESDFLDDRVRGLAENLDSQNRFVRLQAVGKMAELSASPEKCIVVAKFTNEILDAAREASEENDEEMLDRLVPLIRQVSEAATK
jgi:hypothetical protein